jgi:hypothetical protein
VPPIESPSNDYDKRQRRAARRAESQADVDAVAEEPLPPPAELTDEALRELRGILHAPGIEPRDRIQAGRVIMASPYCTQTDPMGDLRARLGTPAKLKAWALAVAEGAQREIDASAAGGKALASSPKVRQEPAPAGESLQSAKGAGNSPAGEPSE